MWLIFTFNWSKNMAHQIAAILVHQVAEDFINGNISDVKKSLRGLKGFNAAYLGIQVCRVLTAEEADNFTQLINKWAE